MNKRKDKITFYCRNLKKNIDLDEILNDYENKGEKYCNNLYGSKVIECIKELPIFKKIYKKYYINLLSFQLNQI